MSIHDFAHARLKLTSCPVPSQYSGTSHELTARRQTVPLSTICNEKE